MVVGQGVVVSQGVDVVVDQVVDVSQGVDVVVGQGVDVVLDCVGGSYWQQNSEVLSMDGRWVIYGSMGTELY